MSYPLTGLPGPWQNWEDMNTEVENLSRDPGWSICQHQHQLDYPEQKFIKIYVALVPVELTMNSFIDGCGSVGYGYIFQTIREDTRNAILKHSKRAKKEENDQIFKFFQPNDWLIYNRGVIFGHVAYAPGVLQTYDVISTNGIFHVYIMIGKKEDKFDLCSELVAGSMDYIKKRNPNANVTLLKMSTQYVDFSRLVFAPNVLTLFRGGV